MRAEASMSEVAKMSEQNETMVSPPIERLLDHTQSKFRLVTLGSRRARQINAYFGQLGEGLGSTIPPQVTSVSRKPLSIAFEEIDADKIRWAEVSHDEPVEADIDLDAAAPDDAG
jgi:DNA-directed RNA polymerase subunit omega